MAPQLSKRTNYFSQAQLYDSRMLSGERKTSGCYPLQSPESCISAPPLSPLDPGKRRSLSPVTRQLNEALQATASTLDLMSVPSQRHPEGMAPKGQTPVSEEEMQGGLTNRSVERELKMSHQKIKALKNSLRSLVEPEDNKYIILEPNNTNKDSEANKGIQ